MNTQRALLWVIIAASIALTGCTTSQGGYIYQESLLGGLFGERAHHSRRGWALSEQASIGVAPFQNTYLTDAQMLVLQRKLARELAKSFAQVTVITEGSSISEWLKEASGRQNHYLITPVLTEALDKLSGLPELLDNPATENIGPDSIAIKISLYNVTTTKLIDLALLEIKGPWLALQNQRAIDLAGDAFALYAQRLNATPHL